MAKYDEVLAVLPAGTKWSSSFGYPGKGGYLEYHRDPEGVVYVISNGSWMSFAPFEWSMRKLEKMSAPTG